MTVTVSVTVSVSIRTVNLCLLASKGEGIGGNACWQVYGEGMSSGRAFEIEYVIFSIAVHKDIIVTIHVKGCV